MEISESSAASLGHILADALHQCDNTAERRGALRVREAILDALERDCQRSDADWQRYCAFVNRFDDRLDHLEPITPTDAYEPSVSPRDCAMGGEENSNWT
jgi:hypothetical protein